MNPLGWPVTLNHAGVTLRPLHRRDHLAWQRVREANLDWLTPWEATAPNPATSPPPTFASYVRMVRAQARDGTALPFVTEFAGQLVGQVTVAPIGYGAMWSGSVGYWISRAYAGRGITPMAVAMVADYCFATGLHRLEINIRPENTASLTVVEKLGFRDEGIRRRYLHIDGDWRDHRTFALTAEEFTGRFVDRVPPVT